MPTRVILSKDQIRVSKEGYDANSNTLEEFVLHENMNVMAVFVFGSCYLDGKDQRFYIDFPKPIQNLPYPIMTSDDGVTAGRFTYGFETSQEDGVYKRGKIRNFDGNARTITYTILRGF